MLCSRLRVSQVCKAKPAVSVAVLALKILAILLSGLGKEQKNAEDRWRRGEWQAEGSLHQWKPHPGAVTLEQVGKPVEWWSGSSAVSGIVQLPWASVVLGSAGTVQGIITSTNGWPLPTSHSFTANHSTAVEVYKPGQRALEFCHGVHTTMNVGEKGGTWCMKPRTAANETEGPEKLSCCEGDHSKHK